MYKNICEFQVKYLQLLNENGEILNPDFHNISKDELINIYTAILKTRYFDRKAVSLQRTGKLGTFPSSYGQEAIYSVIGKLMHQDDILCPYYRDQGAMLQRGVLAEEILAYWGGDERGSCYRNQKKDFPISVPIASQCLHAVGIAYAMKYKYKNRAVVTTIGEGGTSKGDFYEAMNFSSIHNLPVIFIINNNKWAISIPSSQQSNTKTYAQKAIAAGIEGIKVDGNDVFSLHYAIKNSLNKAYSGGGPSVIEADTYRLSDHTTADDATRYVPKPDLDKALSIEPLIRLRKYLFNCGYINDETDKDINEKIKIEINHSISKYLDMPIQDIRDIKRYLFAENLHE